VTGDWWGWSWLLSVVGVVGFILAGRKVWWAWWINVGCQVLWLAYSLLTQQWGFLFGVAIYSVAFTRNAVRWTREEREKREHERALRAPDRPPVA